MVVVRLLLEQVEAGAQVQRPTVATSLAWSCYDNLRRRKGRAQLGPI